MVVTRLLQGCYKVVTRLLQGCNKVVTTLKQTWNWHGNNHVTGLLQPCYNPTLGCYNLVTTIPINASTYLSFDNKNI